VLSISDKALDAAVDATDPALLHFASIINSADTLAADGHTVALIPWPTDPAVDLAGFLSTVGNDADLSFAIALGDPDAQATASLADASIASGSFDIDDDNLVGSMSFHTADAATFVERYNILNRPSTQGENPTEEPLVASESVVDGLDAVLVPLPAYPLNPTPEQAFNSRVILKKLFVGMTALEYADGVGDRSELAWLDFVVKSEQFPEPFPSAGSVYIRWEFRDQAAIDEFERNELPAGFRIAPTRFIESDDPDGEIFFALNLYDAAGGTVVGGARAEWDVFVHGPDGADPNAGVRPRFGVVQALAEEVSADAGNLLTPAEPVSHRIQEGNVVSAVAQQDADGNAVPVFESSFPIPVPGQAPVARFTREMAIGNDYIYWAHGVSDRVLYNATTFNHDAHLVDVSQFTFTDNSRWAKYLNPQVKDAVYYQNTLEYVASPMENLVDSEHLDITDEWRDELIRFTTNGHQQGLMNTAVSQLFAGTGDAFVGKEISNTIPATFFHFEITDPAGFEASLALQPGLGLAPTTLFVDDSPGHYLTLSVYEFDDSPEGTRAEFSVYTDAGDGRPPHHTVIHRLTEHPAFDPATIFNIGDTVDHQIDTEGQISTRLTSSTVSFSASLPSGEATERPLHLDWIEAGDTVCSINGICDRYYYDAETLDVPVKVSSNVSIAELATPWNGFIDTVPTATFFRDNFQQYAIKPWYNLDVPTEPLPFSGVDNPTHTLSGVGGLTGRDSDLVDSEYSYSGDDCIGNGLMCTGIDPGDVALYTVQELDPSDPNSITWQLNTAIDLGGRFGVADTASTITADAN